MESVKNSNDINNLVENKIVGDIEIENSEIKFFGFNNILYCDSGIKLRNSHINFVGNNSIIYLSFTDNDYVIEVYIRNNSTVFIGKNNDLGTSLNINVQERQNVIIGEDNVIGNNVTLRTIDTFPIYDSNSFQRVNYSKSIFIGDHVWIDHFTYISRGAKIGSGSIVGVNSFIPPLEIVKSNTYVIGNPAKPINENVFFTKNFVGIFTPEDTENTSIYKSDAFIYNVISKETLSMENLDNILKDLSVNERLEFVQKLFIKNKRKNRFSI